jgi:hypothetical protein
MATATVNNIPASSQLDELLELVVRSLQLTQTQHRSAEAKYLAVGSWLHEADSPLQELNPEIYPQGSLRIGTTVRPIKYCEFDLDLVSELSDPRLEATQAYELVWARMHSSQLYRPLMERRPRCIRLNYSGDFHLDVVPAIVGARYSADDSGIFIPDREKRTWLQSDPKGYARWFEARCLKRRLHRRIEGRIEPLRAPQSTDEKAPLKLAVQLWKRWRDITFRNRPELAPSSIVLTTLAALVYDGQDDVCTGFTAIINGVQEWAHRERILLTNPVNSAELLTEKWWTQPQTYDAFVVALDTLVLGWNSTVSRGVFPFDVANALNQFFGQDVGSKVLSEYAVRRKEARDAGTLHVARTSGTLAMTPAAAALRVPPHLFYGTHDK